MTLIDYAVTFGLGIAGGVTANIATHYLFEFLKNDLPII